MTQRTPHTRATLATLATLATTLLLTGCSQWFAPSFEQVQAETRSEMHWALDQLPEDVVIKWAERPKGSTAPCGNGTMFTGNWDVDVVEGFNRNAWIDKLQNKYTKRGYTIEEDAVSDDENDYLSTSAPNGILISVSTYEQRSGSHAISIMGYSNCSNKPYDYHHASGSTPDSPTLLSRYTRNVYDTSSSEQ